MIVRVIAVLGAAFLAGCATSEGPRVTATALPVVSPAIQTAPIVTSPTTAGTAQSPAAVTTAPSAMPPIETSAPAAYGQPTLPAGVAMASDAGKCRTVGDATMCDAPADPYADFARNTN